MAETMMPTYNQMMQPTIDALRALGGQGNGVQIAEKVIDNLKIPAEIAAETHGPDSNHTEVEYRLMWTRTYLKKVGLIDNPRRGTWELTDEEWTCDEIDPKQIVRTVNSQMKAERETNGHEDHAVEKNKSDLTSDGDLHSDAPSRVSQTPLYPTYQGARYFLKAIDGTPYAHYRDMENDIALEQIDDANKAKLNGVFRNIDFNSEAALGRNRQRNEQLRHLLAD